MFYSHTYTQKVDLFSFLKVVMLHNQTIRTASYLSKRRQRVGINGQSSDWVYILAGVPQGSIDINDIVKHI